MNKKTRTYLITISTCIFFTCSVNAFAECEKTLKIAWMGLWEPFNLGSPSAPQGLDLEILDAIITEAGCNLVYSATYFPWARHIRMIESGETDLITAAGKTPEREKFSYLIGPYRSEHVGLYVLKKDIKKHPIQEPNDLLTQEFTLGTFIGYNYGSELNRVIKQLGSKNQAIPEREELPNRANYLKLKTKRIDGYLGYPVVETLDLKTMGFDDEIVLHPMHLVKTGDIYILLSKKSNTLEMANTLQNSLERIKSNGVYDTILKKYSERYNIPKW